MNGYVMGTDAIIGAASEADAFRAKFPLVAAPAPEQKPTVNFLQRPAFGGMRVWQVGTIGLGLATLVGGVVLLAVRRK